MVPGNVPLLSQLIVPRPVRSLALLIFAAPKLAKELPDLHEFCPGTTFATAGKSEWIANPGTGQPCQYHEICFDY